MKWKQRISPLSVYLMHST